eukprot:c23852_g1_i3 orf=959-1921(-)
MARHHNSPSRHAGDSELPDWALLNEQLLQFAAIIAVAAIVASLGIFSVEWYKRRSLPFCDSYGEVTGSCISCPDEGKCWKGILECLPGFVRQGKSCKKDKQMDWSTQVLADFIQLHVCRIHGQSLCKGAGTIWLTLVEILQEMKQAGIQRQLGIDHDAFMLAFDEAVDLTKKILIFKETNNGMQELQCPVHLVGKYKPFFCRFRGWMGKNYVPLIIITSLVYLMAKLLSHIYYQRKLSARAEQLYLQVCEALEQRATMKDHQGETWVIASKLRDHLLKPSERRDSSLWRQVELMLQKDSRVDQYPKLVKGEPKVVWEWQV